MLNILTRFSLALVSAIALIAVACSGGTAEETPAAVYTAVDYAFQGPDSIPAGWNELRVANIGRELHHAQLVRLPQGVDGGELMASFVGGDIDQSGDLFASFEAAGGPSSAGPGTSISAYANLEAGNYLLICAIPTAEGVPHFLLGMAKPITVTANAEPTEPPEEDLSLSLVDFGFDVSEAVTAGTHTFRVTNSGPQDHEAFLVELDPGTNVEGFIAAVSPGAPPGRPPGTPVGGVQAIRVGDEGYFTATFVSNRRYALLCFIEDPETGAPHFALGMVDEFVVE